MDNVCSGSWWPPCPPHSTPGCGACMGYRSGCTAAAGTWRREAEGPRGRELSAMRILFLACMRANTGNSTTADRIRSHLEAAGHECELRDAAGVQSSSEVAKLISQRKFDAGLAIHMYKAGRFLLGNRIPFGVIFGGTDINEDVKNEEKCRVMGAVLEDARFAVAFTCKIKEVAAKHWPQALCKIHIQPQGILTMPSVSFDFEAFLHNAGMIHLPGNAHIFLLVCGLRRVKDPLYLVEVFAVTALLTDWWEDVYL